MSMHTKFVELFSTSSSKNVAEENLQYYKFSCNIENVNIPTEQNLQNLIDKIADNDSYVISFFLEDADPTSLTSTNPDFSNFLSSLQRTIGTADNEPINFEIRINKSIRDAINIYDLDTFSEYLNSQSLKGLYTIFNRELNARSRIFFQSTDIRTQFSSKTIFFNNQDSEPQDSEFDREKYNEKIRSISHSDIPTDLLLLPDDFDFDFESIPHQNLSLALKRILFLTLIQCLYDISSYNSDNGIYFKLNGYKSMSGVVVKEDFALDSIPVYLDIYKWLISSGSIIDKSGISRNIISLHLGVENGLAISENTFLSIKSSFKIYEKENIKQYIEIRNKISDQILDYYKRASQITNSFASGFQKSLIAVLTFFSSVIALRVISGNSENLDNLITFDAYVLTLLFILSSVLYLVYSRKEIKSQRQRFIEGYYHLKERYNDLLLSEDINRIVNDDKEFKTDLQFINDKTSWYTQLWIWTLSIMFLISTLLCFKDFFSTVFIQVYFFCARLFE